MPERLAFVSHDVMGWHGAGGPMAVAAAFLSAAIRERTAPVSRLSTPEIPATRRVSLMVPAWNQWRATNGSRQPMEAKVIDHVWSLEEIAGLAKIRFDKTPPNP